MILASTFCNLQQSMYPGTYAAIVMVQIRAVWARHEAKVVLNEKNVKFTGDVVMIRR